MQQTDKKSIHNFSSYGYTLIKFWGYEGNWKNNRFHKLKITNKIETSTKKHILWQFFEKSGGDFYITLSPTQKSGGESLPHSPPRFTPLHKLILSTQRLLPKSPYAYKKMSVDIPCAFDITPFFYMRTSHSSRLSGA